MKESIGKELSIGYISSADLAAWFGIKPNTLSKNKEKKLEQLKKYAQFEIKNKKVYITKVLNPYYSKGFDIVLNHMDETWNENGLDSCSRVGLELLQKYELQLQPSTVYAYTRKSRDLLYGKPFTSIGILGSCIYVWCKRKEDEEHNVSYDFLTQEEEEIKQKLIKKYFGDATEKQLLVQGMVDAGEITKEQAWDVLQELTNMHGSNFMAFLKELQKQIGCQVVRGTLVERNIPKEIESAF